MNIGLEALAPRKTVAVASMESILSEYISCESMFADTNRFCEYGDQLFDTFDNICSIASTAKKFGSTEGLAVLDALVGHELGGHVSVEALKDTGKSVWYKIKEFFAKIWNWIKMFFQRIISLFVKTETRLKKLEIELAKAEKAGIKINEWRYIGLPNLLGKKVGEGVGLDSVFKSFSASIDGAATEAAAKEIYDKSIEGKSKSASYGEVSSVTTVSDSLIKIKAVSAMLRSVKSLSGTVEGSYKAAKTKVDNLSSKATPEALGAAKLEQKKMALKVKWVNKLSSLATRSAMSVLANCKVAKTNARLDKPTK